MKAKRRCSVRRGGSLWDRGVGRCVVEAWPLTGTATPTSSGVGGQPAGQTSLISEAASFQIREAFSPQRTQRLRGSQATKIIFVVSSGPSASSRYNGRDRTRLILSTNDSALLHRGATTRLRSAHPAAASFLSALRALVRETAGRSPRAIRAGRPVAIVLATGGDGAAFLRSAGVTARPHPGFARQSSSSTSGPAPNFSSWQRPGTLLSPSPKSSAFRSPTEAEPHAARGRQSFSRKREPQA